MAQNDVLKRYIDTGLAFTALTQARAEALVKELVKAGEVQADQAREAVADLVERSRRNSEKLLETVRREVKEQITGLGLVSKADLDKAEARLSSLLGAAAAPVRKAADSASSAASAAGRASATAAASAKKATSKKAPAAKKAPAKKARRRRPRPRRPRRSRPEPLARRRLDAELVRRGLARSRQQAQADILAGRVTVGGAPATKAARLVAPGRAPRGPRSTAPLRQPGRREARRRPRAVRRARRGPAGPRRRRVHGRVHRLRAPAGGRRGGGGGRGLRPAPRAAAGRPQGRGARAHERPRPAPWRPRCARPGSSSATSPSSPCAPSCRPCCPWSSRVPTWSSS